MLDKIPTGLLLSFENFLISFYRLESHWLILNLVGTIDFEIHWFIFPQKYPAKWSETCFRILVGMSDC